MSANRKAATGESAAYTISLVSKIGSIFVQKLCNAKLKNQQMSTKCYNRSVCVKAYNKTCIYICNNELVKYKVTIFLLIRIEIKFWYKVLNNFYHNMFCLNAHIPLFL